MLPIKHAPLFDTAKVEKIYSEKDGVPVKYVCTTATNVHATFAADGFYRATPHPEFGNRYFGLYRNPYADSAEIMITNADAVEDFDFAMIKDRDGNYWYSSHRHDCLFMDGSMIDGGRSYVRSSGLVEYFKIKDGEFIQNES